MCVGELCWTRAKDDLGNDIFVVDVNCVAFKIVEAGGGVLNPKA